MVFEQSNRVSFDGEHRSVLEHEIISFKSWKD